MTNQSVVMAKNSFYPVVSQPSSKISGKIGLAMNKAMDAEVAKSVAQKEGLIYDFEFKVGQDIRRTLPTFLDSLVDTTVIDHEGVVGNFDYILAPKVNSTVFTYVGLSAAPRYELTITLDVPVIKDGKITNHLIIRKDARVEISAFENMDVHRTETMTQKYQEQLQAIYNDLEVELRRLLVSDYKR